MAGTIRAMPALTGFVSAGGAPADNAYVQLQNLTGLETLQILRSFNHELPVILITGDSSAGLIRQAFQAQAYSVIPKPVSKNVLLHTLFRALGRALGTRSQN